MATLNWSAWVRQPSAPFFSALNLRHLGRKTTFASHIPSYGMCTSPPQFLTNSLLSNPGSCPDSLKASSKGTQSLWARCTCSFTKIRRIWNELKGNETDLTSHCATICVNLLYVNRFAPWSLLFSLLAKYFFVLFPIQNFENAFFRLKV